MDEISAIKTVVAFSGERVFFELENGLYASASVIRDLGNIVLFPWAEIFLQYIYEEDIPEPTDEQLENAKYNYNKYAADAKMLIVD